MPVAASYLSIKTVDGLTLYAVLRQKSTLNYGNTFTATMEGFVSGHWYSGGSNNYAIAGSKTQLSANVSAEYAFTMPSFPAGVYYAEIYVQQGATPALTDGTPAWVIEDVLWNGTALLPSVSTGLSQDVNVVTVGGQAVTPVSEIDVNIAPIISTVVNPLPVDTDIVVTQYSAQSFTWVLLDANGNPVDCGGKDVEIRGYSQVTGVMVVSYDSVSDPQNIVIGGASDNQITVTFKTTDTATVPNELLYTLWNKTDSLPLAEGKITFRAAAQP